MKKPVHMILVKFLLFIAFLPLSLYASAQMPDTLANRYATASDAIFWPSVNEGDYIFFQGNIRDGAAIFAGGTVFKVELPVGSKILIWRGNYERILIDGELCANTEETPTIITNLGGQVRWGESYADNTKRTFEITGFEYLNFTGKYDQNAQTGNENFLGHNDGENYHQPNYYQKYGFWGNPRWSGFRTTGRFSNVVRIRGFKQLKMSYIAATEGGFAGFNIKTDNPDEPERVTIDIQDCFAGWHESEGFYVSFSSRADNQDITQLIFRNNIMAYCGAESLQTDNLTEGTIIENNVAINGASFHRIPFMDKFQDGLHQFSFVEGGITVQNNLMIGGNSLHQIRYKNAGEGRAFPDPNKKVLMRNNYYGYSRSNVSFVWQGDGITPYEVDGNIYGPVSTPSTRDAYNEDFAWDDYFRVCNTNNPITIKNTMYPTDRLLVNFRECGTSMIDTVNNVPTDVPTPAFVNSGFPQDIDYRDVTFWSPTYGTADKMGIFIDYKVGDHVFYFDENGRTRFYKCKIAHAGDFDPNNSPDQWEQLSWDGAFLPPLDLRMEPESFYANKGIGLTYQEISSVTAVETDQEEVSQIQLYPNPSNGFFQIKIPEVIGNDVPISVQLLTLGGEMVYERTVRPINHVVSMNTKGLTSGIYIIHLMKNEHHFTSKLVIE